MVVSFNVPKIILKPAMQICLHDIPRVVKLEEVVPKELLPKHSMFLAQKTHVNALLFATKTEEEFLGIMQQLLQDIMESSKQSSDQTSNISASEKSKPLVNLEDDNKDDCFVILPPIL